MFRPGTALRLSACLSLTVALTACFKFTPEVTALPSTQDSVTPPGATKYKQSGYFSAFEGRTATSTNSHFKLRGNLDRTSTAANSSTSFGYSATTSPVKNTDGKGGTL